MLCIRLIMISGGVTLLKPHGRQHPPLIRLNPRNNGLLHAGARDRFLSSCSEGSVCLDTASTTMMSPIIYEIPPRENDKVSGNMAAWRIHEKQPLPTAQKWLHALGICFPASFRAWPGGEIHTAFQDKEQFITNVQTRALGKNPVFLIATFLSEQPSPGEQGSKWLMAPRRT